VAAKKKELKKLMKRKFKNPPKSAEDRRAESKKNVRKLEKLCLMMDSPCWKATMRHSETAKRLGLKRLCFNYDLRSVLIKSCTNVKTCS
jgi:hypothetical protein